MMRAFFRALRPGFWLAGLLTGLLVGTTPALANKNKLFKSLSIKTSPDKAAWQSFHQMPAADREQFWLTQEKSGIRLADWAWEWRIGWIRQCKKADSPACTSILAQGLNDAAVVVRAETATHLGVLYDGSQNEEALKRLEAAFQRKENSRNKKPLFIQQRILFAMIKIGGEQALQRGEALAAQYPQTKRYWTKAAKTLLAQSKNANMAKPL